MEQNKIGGCSPTYMFSICEHEVSLIANGVSYNSQRIVEYDKAHESRARKTQSELGGCSLTCLQNFCAMYAEQQLAYFVRVKEARNLTRPPNWEQQRS